MRCSHCGAALGRDAAWCGMCLASVPGYAPPGSHPAGSFGAPGYPQAPPPAGMPGYPPAAPGYLPPAAPGYPQAPPPAGMPRYPAESGYPPPGYPPAPGYALPPAGAQYLPAAAAPLGAPEPMLVPAAGFPGGLAARQAPFAYQPPVHQVGWPGAYYHPPAPEPAPEVRTAGWTTFAAIAVGALMQGVLWLLTVNKTIENEAAIRYSIVTAIAVYAVVTYLVVTRIQTDGHPLRWVGSWGYVPAAAAGLLLGGGVAWVMLSISQSEGVEGGDQGIALLVSEGTFPYIAAAFLIVCVAAPIVEELLFRGLLLASLLHKGAAAAVWISGFAFAAWHLNPAQLRYYSVAGALLGVLFLKQGLVCSMAAHAAFNGTLLLAAVAYAIAPGPTVVQGDLTLKAPDGWHAVADAPIGYLHGPSRAEVLVFEIGGTYDGVAAAELVAKVQLGTMPELSGFDVRGDTAHTIALPAGEAVRVQVVHEGRDGELVMLPTAHALYVVVLASGGSASVRGDFETMLSSIAVADG